MASTEAISPRASTEVQRRKVISVCMFLTAFVPASSGDVGQASLGEFFFTESREVPIGPMPAAIANRLDRLGADFPVQRLTGRC